MIYRNNLTTKYYRMLRPPINHACPGGPYEWALWRQVVPVLWGLFYLPKGEPFWLDMDGFYPITQTTKTTDQPATLKNNGIHED